MMKFFRGGDDERFSCGKFLTLSRIGRSSSGLSVHNSNTFHELLLTRTSKSTQRSKFCNLDKFLNLQRTFLYHAYFKHVNFFTEP